MNDKTKTNAGLQACGIASLMIVLTALVSCSSPTEPEPHYAVIIKADKLDPVEIYKKDDPYWHKNPNATWTTEDARIERRGSGDPVRQGEADAGIQERRGRASTTPRWTGVSVS